MGTITSAEADKKLNKKWFGDYTDKVTVMENSVIDGNFDAEERSSELGDVENILFEGGLTVKGDMRLGSDAHSIFCVTGDLEVGGLELGDAVLVVTGKIKASKYIFTPSNEGIFEVGGQQVPPWDNVLTPVFFWFDREGDKYRLFVQEGEGMKEVEAPEFVAEAKDSDGAINSRRVVSLLQEVKMIYK